MKKIFKRFDLNKFMAVAVGFAIMGLNSCKKFTELQPLSSLSTTTAFSTTANVELAANGMYNTAAVGTYNGGGGRGYAFGAASIEQGEMRGEDMINIASFYQITYQATYDASTGSANNYNMWINLYSLINQCNTFIAGVRQAASSGVLTAANASAYEGEARFLRALAHHELLIQFCRPYLDGNGSQMGVPYRTIAINSQAAVQDALQLDRGTVAQDYTKILEDLDYAENNLPSAQKITRATKGAAIALKTRIKLHMGDWAGVITEGAKLGTSGTAPFTSPVGNYKLTASPDGPFYTGVSSLSGNYANNTESVFSVAQSSLANGSVNGALPNMFGPASIIINGVTSSQGGRNLVCTSPNLYNASFWVTGDLRRSLLQIQQGTTNAKYFFNWKYRDVTTQSDYAPIIRYAEVLLNVAEAYARTNNTTQALALLNAVRNRAVVNVADQYTVASFATSKAMTQAILNERRIEFAGEGRRWADIHRLAKDADFTTGGIPAKILIAQVKGDGSSYDVVNRPVITPSFAAIPYSDYRFIWPIPAPELTANPTLAKQQNPNY
ncbi:RagB/SusD family nutrient uptake outer membrane protein [Mucilaginibacter sp. RS28]|uniref:RagB/SusD family nutrient uptake outer membrane protein n=1 Tax=Mucilaginibacter straminoryzae TaxID=2932774 RepID=A0A9X2BEV2_9SPHI|nr:RagB/SusD family nutrient uptake outer membrane protein [Mucilaginibacter straminoryzae]MCJ8211803.1 RagB/SusD family nutrient uptake outer membrane protein [Mucilaginibacter straminoryzae]